MTLPPSSAGLSRIPLGIRLSALTRLPRTVGSAIASAFRRSLEVRIVAITVALSAIALLATGTYMSYTIGNGLFQARVDQVRAESDRAVDAAQSLFDSTTAADGSALSVLQLQVLTQVESIATSNAGIALQRAPGTQVNFAVPNVSTRGTAILLSDELQNEMSTGQDDQYYQSVSIPAAGAPHPGLIVGSTVNVPTQGDLPALSALRPRRRPAVPLVRAEHAAHRRARAHPAHRGCHLDRRPVRHRARSASRRRPAASWRPGSSKSASPSAART